MHLLTEEQIVSKNEEVLRHMERGAVIVYPTDTVYSLGCDALDSEAVKRLRDIKESDKSFSVIVPSKDWILDNCEVNKDAAEFIEQNLPGAYTLHLPLKNKAAVSEHVTNGDGKIGIRLIDHHFQSVVSKFGKPFVTTSANRVNKEIMTHLDRLDVKIKSKVDAVLYEGEKYGKSSRIVDLTK